MFRIVETQNKRQKFSSNAYLWHLILCHISINRIGRLVKSIHLNQLEDNSVYPCESCVEGKMTRGSFTGIGLKAKKNTLRTHEYEPLWTNEKYQSKWIVQIFHQFHR